MNLFLRDELATIIAEEMASIPSPPPVRVSSALEWRGYNEDLLAPVVLDQSPKARTLREIRRIAYRYPWGPMLIQRAMDDAGVAIETDLSEVEASILLMEIRRHDDRAQHVCDDDQAPPAR